MLYKRSTNEKVALAMRTFEFSQLICFADFPPGDVERGNHERIAGRQVSRKRKNAFQLRNHVHSVVKEHG